MPASPQYPGRRCSSSDDMALVGPCHWHSSTSAGDRPMSGILTLMNGLLNDRIAVVTGGGGGIGAATARLFADHGAEVIIADIDAELARQTVDQITASGGSAVALGTDVCDADQVAELARAVSARHGRVDVLVNNV